MAKYRYELSENGWEYTGYITVESSEEPICVNDDSKNEHYLIVNGARIDFDEEIRNILDETEDYIVNLQMGE